MEIWGGLAPLWKLPEWNPQTQVLLGVPGKPGILSDPRSLFWASGFVTVSPACSTHLLISQAPPLWAQVLNFPFPTVPFSLPPLAPG